MTDDELKAIRELHESMQGDEGMISPVIRNYGKVIGKLLAEIDCLRQDGGESGRNSILQQQNAGLRIEIDSLRPMAEAWDAHCCPITLGEWLAAKNGRELAEPVAAEVELVEQIAQTGQHDPDRVRLGRSGKHQGEIIAAEQSDRETLARTDAPSKAFELLPGVGFPNHDPETCMCRICREHRL